MIGPIVGLALGCAGVALTFIAFIILCCSKKGRKWTFPALTPSPRRVHSIAPVTSPHPTSELPAPFPPEWRQRLTPSPFLLEPPTGTSDSDNPQTRRSHKGRRPHPAMTLARPPLSPIPQSPYLSSFGHLTAPPDFHLLDEQRGNTPGAHSTRTSPPAYYTDGRRKF